ncbi:hemerythrin HHE cation binding domain-containing protein [Mumia flava]|uniref:Hemerythrin HHE cation binding domain-containing protein n=1 Tax=Mumia flava TaxID=1348852 RepID=A0A2M9BF84_9ACTN|nr:hemerythrin domain-containing protein [Mumia flava]PJJ56615.1 hemerythrin HHE cation binding domain-containing protein [Mumia flava]
MNTTPTPDDADSPPRKTCDASGMAEIHRMFRAGFGEGPELVRGVRQGDTTHAETVARHLTMLSVGLHAHHEGEDERLWPALEARAPACALHVERMKAQHAEMLVQLDALDAALPSWRTSATDPAAVLAALGGINAALAEHLPDEEKTIVPAMETTLTEKEIQWFSTHGRKATPKGQTWDQLGAILDAQPDGDLWMRKHLPAPVRLLWRWRGKAHYERTRAALRPR